MQATAVSHDSAAQPLAGAGATPSATGQATAAVSVQGVVKRYGSHLALDGASLTVNAGELFALLGPNGSGKSTLLRILATLLQADAGQVTLDGHDLRTQAAAARHSLGVVFQSPSLDAQLSVVENLRFQGWLYGLSGKLLSQRVEAAMARADLTGRATTRAGQLSGGLKRRVELAKALLHRPRVLLLDEPSTGLDPAARIAFWDEVQRLRAEDGLTVIAATHLLDEAERCDRVALLDNGRLAALDTPAALKTALGSLTLFVEATQSATAQAELMQRLKDLPGVNLRPARGGVLVEGPGPLPDPRAVLDAAGELAQSVRLGRPTLEDVYLHLTGRRIGADGSTDETAAGHTTPPGEDAAGTSATDGAAA